MKTQNYYKSTTFQIGANAKPVTVEADRKLVLSMTRALQGQGDGTIGLKDAERILANIADAGKYGGGEKVPARALLAATDDRVKVTMQVGPNGKKVQIRLTDAAEKAFAADLSKFYGSLGGAKTAKVSANQAAQSLE